MVKTCQLWMVIPCLPHMEFVSMFSHTWLKLPPPVLPRRSTDWPAYLTRFERTSTRGLRWPLPPLTRSSCEGSATVAGASEDIRVEKSAKFPMVAGQSSLRRDKPGGGGCLTYLYREFRQRLGIPAETKAG